VARPLFSHRTIPSDKVVGRQLETQAPAEFGPNPSGFSFVRWKDIGLAKPLDLVHEFPPAERVLFTEKSSKRCFSLKGTWRSRKSVRVKGLPNPLISDK
jgi:hypothetical protein